MTKPLSFKLPGLSAATVAEIGNAAIGAIELPRYGCLTPGEEIALSQYMLKLKEQSVSEMKLDVATLLLKSRHDTAWTRRDTEQQIQDFGLIEALYDFMLAERSRHAPKGQLLQVQGDGAAAIADQVAEQHQAISATREDFKALETYFVFRRRDDVPSDFEVIRDCSGEIEEIHDLAMGKGQKKSTGTPASGD
jgi:hypothetical protein